jgi:eukaryotic-like serine/threonine-protein kinase
VQGQARSPYKIENLEPEQLHHVEVFKDGYRGWSTRVSLKAGQHLRLPLVELVPQPSAAIEAARPAALAMDLSEDAARPPPERSPVAARRTTAPRREAEPRRVQEREGIAPRKIGSGVLRLNSRPWAEVSIDGKRVGNTPLTNHPLPAGAHTVRLVNPQFGLKKTLKIEIEPGQTLTQVVDLE